MRSFWMSWMGVLLAGCSTGSAPAPAPSGAPLSCIKCIKRFPAEEAEVRGHPYDEGHRHVLPCQCRVHKDCGTVVFERKAWTARGRAKDDKPFAGAAAKCGSEIPWARTLEEARRRAEESKRPIAWWVTTLEGSPTDRKLFLEQMVLAGPLMMPDVVRLLSDHFVPLRRPAEASDRELYGLAPIDFIEPGFVFLTPDLKILHKADRIITFSEEWFSRLLVGVLRASGQSVEGRGAPASPARRSLAEGRPDPSLFEGSEDPEARYFRGVALHLTGREEEGREVWKKIREGRWSWKAAAELSGNGPFVRGFEVYDALPAGSPDELPRTTTRARATPDVGRAVRFLLQRQRPNGGWEDCNYNFGGDESLPNVYTAVTALAALALREWGEPAAIGPAIARAEQYLKDEGRVAPEDADELVWAHAFRLLYFARTGDRGMMSRLVRKLAELQMPDGIWYHEYPASFTSALVIHALMEAQKAGAEVPRGLLHRGGQALSACRNESGIFSYHYPSKKHNIEGGAGRLPLCEYATLPAGLATRESVAAAIEESFKHQDRLERVRKYDNHADPFGNAGFFFWYSQYGRTVAARAVGAASALARQKEIVLTTQEIDGCWVDSHELGRTYGTALALLTLKLCAN